MNKISKWWSGVPKLTSIRYARKGVCLQLPAKSVWEEVVFPKIFERSDFEILNSVKESLISERAALCEVGLLNIIIGDLPISATRLPVSAGSKKISSVLWNCPKSLSGHIGVKHSDGRVSPLRSSFGVWGRWWCHKEHINEVILFWKIWLIW